MKNFHWFKSAAAACLLLPAVNASAVMFDFELEGQIQRIQDFGGRIFGTETYTPADVISGSDNGSAEVGADVVKLSGSAFLDFFPANAINVGWDLNETDEEIVITVTGGENPNGILLDALFQNVLQPDQNVKLRIYDLSLGLGFPITVQQDAKLIINNNPDPIINQGSSGIFSFLFTPDRINQEGTADRLEVTINYTRQDNGGGTIPEPATLALLGLGLLGMGAARRRRT